MMDERILWAILTGKERLQTKKIEELFRNWKDFDKKSIDINSDSAKRIQRDFYYAQSNDIEIVTYLDKDYPDSLRKVPFAPPFFYLRGNRSVIQNEVNVTIVGARKCTNYGMDISMKFSSALAECGIGIVAGGALGIDSAAHRGALNVKGKTIAVFGCGIDVFYPEDNTHLFGEIMKNGAVISEFPMGTPPSGSNFPFRNRIMAGLSKVCVVIEAGRKSGALITARQSADQGKTVFAVPGRITDHNSLGTNDLLRNGAQFALSSDDILEELLEQCPDFFRKGTDKHTDDEIKIICTNNEKEEKTEAKIKERSLYTDDEKAILEVIGRDKLSQDEIIDRLPNVKQLLAKLNILELRGVIIKCFGNKYKLK